MQFKNLLSDKLKAIQAAPRWRVWLVIGALAFAGAYFLWCKFGSRPLAPGATITAAPVPRAVKDEPVKTVNVPVVVYRDRVQVIEKLGLPPAGPKEEVQTAAEIPRMKYGGKAAVFLNTSTGQSRTAITANEAPWFSFERGNAAGIGAAISSRDGQVYSAYYRRDILQIKGAYLVGSVEGNTRPEGKAAVSVEYRW